LSTKTKILDSAEAVFAEQGISASSLRSIVAQAGVNVASVHYHFGSKEELVKAVFARRLGSVNESRLNGLNDLRQKHGSAAIPVRELLRVFLTPALKMGQEVSQSQKNFLLCIARAHAETEDIVQKALLSNLKEVLQEFLAELEKTCPNFSERERLMRFAFSAGAMVHTMLLPLKTIFIEKFFKDGIPEEDLCEMLIDFCAAGFESGPLEKP
jgi:AcrR family transcriptional regulator